MPLLLFFDKAVAQKKNVIIKQGTPAIIKNEPMPQIMGKVAAPVLKDTAILLENQL